MTATTAADDPPRWPPGEGAMAARVRAHDWAATPLGALARWPARLRQAVELSLDAAMPMAVLWGESLVVLPNDALAARWPGGGTCPLGVPYAELQPEGWAIDGERLARLLATGEAQSVPGFWRGRVRAGDPPAGASFSCTPLRDDAGAVRGVLACGAEAPVRDAIERLVHELRDPLAPLRNSLELLRMSRDGVEVALIQEMLERQVQAMVRAVDRLLDAPAALQAPPAFPALQAPPTPAALQASPVPNPPAAAQATAPQPGSMAPDEARPGAPDTPAPSPDRRPGDRRDPSSSGRSRPADLRRPLSASRDVDADGTWPRRRRFAERPGRPAEDVPGRRLDNPAAGEADAEAEAEAEAEALLDAEAELDAAFEAAFGVDPATAGHDLFEVAAAAVGATLPRPSSLDEATIARRVLVVDDHRDAADSLALLLSHLGTEVRTAYGGEEALALLEGWTPEAVLLDLEMPGVDGFEVARRVRATPRLRGLTLVALTGHGQGTDMRRTRAAGIDHHLVKPVRLDVLVDVLAALDGDDDEEGTRH